MKIRWRFLRRRLRPLKPGRYTAMLADVKTDKEGCLTLVFDKVRKMRDVGGTKCGT